MEFQSGIFLAFFAALLAVYHNLPSRAKPWLLLAANAVFYAAGGVQWLPLLAAAVVISWAAALAMDRIAARPARLALLWGCVVLFVGQLFYFKYFSALLRGLFDYRLQIIAPLGVSFYSFTILGYIIDVYCRTQPAEKNLVRYAAFVSMFAQITSGPIERGSNMLPQLAAPRPYSFEQLAQGLSRALWGFYKKFVLANMLANMVGAVYGDVESFSGPFLLLASLLYSYQLYLDFGGYSDIAIGMMQALGYDVMENFRRPFAARSYTQLWDRWHISLTSWFRDYIFTPLSFYNRGLSGALGKLQGWFNIFIIFPISGLWHGDNMGYVIWGALNGLFMVVGKATAKKRRKWAKKNPLYRSRFVKAVVQCSIVYLLFTICIVFFAACYYGGDAADGAYVFTHLFASGRSLSRAVFADAGLSVVILWAVVIGAVFVEIMEKLGRPQQLIRKIWMPVRWVIYYALIAAILLFANFGASGFVYGQY